MQITPLPPAVSDRIRAATAVPTFSRALEELVFNSLDAGATEIVATVNVQALSLSVRDNGRGMDRLALSVVGTSAATSKIRSLEELRGGVHTFGFRGEALHALSTVALVEIVSRCVDPPAAPSLVTVLQHGQRTQPGPAAEARAPGTTVSVRNMFSNRAVARKRHQRPSAAGAELSLLVARMTRLAVASPGVAFRLHDASRGVTLVTKGRAASPLAAFRQLLLCGSHEEQPRLAELSFDDGRYSLHGHLSVLCNGGRIRDAQLLSLNGRPLERTSELHRLIEASYARLHRRLAGQTSSPGSAPAVFCISLTCCPSRYDAAFHKEKSDVMFYDLASVRNALLGALTSFFCREASALDPRDIAAELVCLAAGARDASDDAPREVRDGTHGERRDEAVDEAVDETEGEGGGLVGATSYEAEPGARGSDHGQSASVEADRHELREAGRAGYELQEDRSTGGARASLARARHHPAVLLAALESPATPPPPSPLECQPPARKVDHEGQQRQPLATPPPLGPSSSGNWLSSPRPSAAGRSKRPLDEAPKEEWLGQEGRWEGQEAGREAGQGEGRDGVGPSLGGAVHAAEGPAPGLLAGAHGLPHPAPAHTAAQDGGDGLFGGEGDEAGIARGLVFAALKLWQPCRQPAEPPPAGAPRAPVPPAAFCSAEPRSCARADGEQDHQGRPLAARRHRTDRPPLRGRVHPSPRWRRRAALPRRPARGGRARAARAAAGEDDLAARRPSAWRRGAAPAAPAPRRGAALARGRGPQSGGAVRPRLGLGARGRRRGRHAPPRRPRAARRRARRRGAARVPAPDRRDGLPGAASAPGAPNPRLQGVPKGNHVWGHARRYAVPGAIPPVIPDAGRFSRCPLLRWNSRPT